MNAQTMKHLDKCLEEAARDMEALKDDNDAQRKLRATLMQIKHRAANYFGKVADGQARAAMRYRGRVFKG